MSHASSHEAKIVAPPPRSFTPASRVNVQRRASDSAVPDGIPESVHRTLSSPGRPLDAGTRDFMESRFGHDFSRVRIHADSSAGESAREVNAHAYTVGSKIVFAPGKYRPDSESGRHLLAHELAHTIQQSSVQFRAMDLAVTAPDSRFEHEAASAAVFVMQPASIPHLAAQRVTRGAPHCLSRQTVAGYETKPVNIERADIEQLVGTSYWEQKVATAYSLTFINTVPNRFSADAEEKEAVLSVLWQRRPASPIKADTVVTVSIPPRAGAAKSKALLYQFTFNPAPTSGPLKDRKESVNVEFKAEGNQALVSAAPAPAAGYAPPTLSRNTSGFPNGIDDYWKAHPEEHKQLYSWIEQNPGPTFDQVVTTSETPAKGKKHDSSYQVKGGKDTAGQIKGLDITLLGETPTLIEKPPADYRAKDAADLELDKLRAKPTDKLGAITGLAALPVDELLSVKYAIWQYFGGGTRNKEVDVVLPIAKKQTRVFYTLRFLPKTNNVEVARVGEEGSSVALTATALNIERVEGFAANSADAATFKTWIAKRYPGVTPVGATLAELKNSVNKELEAKAGAAPWFSANYGIEVLDATAAEVRLKTVHKLTAPELAHLKAFAAGDLKRLEFALETMRDATLQIVKGTRVARQDALVNLIGPAKTPTPDPKSGGFTWQNGIEKTVLIFDSASENEERLFLGGTAGVRFSSVGTYIHEFGHVLETQATLAKPFADFVKAEGIAPITWYASSKPVTESFPEAFAVFQADPEWMKSNLPKLFTWIDTVTSTGKPPVKP